ncbi:hypothetical protein AMIS_48300 [Actinoplanes missouriensis 431]|uniref:SWIM-type domain-containing protein n=2 Tax=Actinoplanes missouriensis TaxID=1866 RepID=I0HAL3_ACTM4|nr:hypothetical protein AMIS_48300 [Actinoplanes missouriensis 431]
MFEALRMGPTFARGRRDDRAGHVRSLTVSSSLVTALVRGPDDPVAFRSRIAVRSFGAAEWARVEKALVSEARYAADLLSGRMPDGIEAVFAGAGLGLLPLSLDEVALDCSCERWPMPCVHLAATCYALARTFEGDPFEVFTWRGRSRDELLMRLRKLRESAAVDEAAKAAASRPASSAASSPDEQPGPARPLVDPDDPAAFWGVHPAGVAPAGAERAGAERAGVAPAGAEWAGAEPAGAGPQGFVAPGSAAPLAGVRPDALLDQLDPPPLSHHGQPIVEVLRPAYAALPETEVADRS